LYYSSVDARFPAAPFFARVDKGDIVDRLLAAIKKKARDCYAAYAHAGTGRHAACGARVEPNADVAAFLGAVVRLLPQIADRSNAVSKTTYY